MRRFIEEALMSAVSGDSAPGFDAASAAVPAPPSVWDDHAIGTQAAQPLGAPLDLSEDDARRLALEAFDFQNRPAEPALDADDDGFQALGHVGDPVDISDEDAAQIAREALMFDMPLLGRTEDG